MEITENYKMVKSWLFWHYLLNIAQRAKYVLIFILLAPIYLEKVFSIVYSFAEFMKNKYNITVMDKLLTLTKWQQMRVYDFS